MKIKILKKVLLSVPDQRVKPHGESLQSFCVKNKVPYNIFQKMAQDTRK